MKNRFLKLCSTLLTLVLLLQTVPIAAHGAEETTGTDIPSSVTQAEEAFVVMELPQGRGKYHKEFLLSNGNHLAAVYADAVHYQKDGQWAEIDNTLTLSGTGTNAVYTNTAGPWDVSFPQQFSKDRAITITKDGHTLSFYMSGELRGNSNVSIMNTETQTLAQPGTITAQTEQVDVAALQAQSRHPQAVAQKNHSRLEYASVFSSTDIVYDLVSDQVKESIVIREYNTQVQGYRYTLNVGGMIPVLQDSGDILLLGADKKTVVMTMPAPYLADNAGEYNFDVGVSLTGSGSTYTLTYLLPVSWMADDARQYPVILDPVVVAGDSYSNVADITVCEMEQSDLTSSLLNVGSNLKHGNMRSYIMFNNLPALAPSDVIVEATLNLLHISINYASFAVGVHKVSSTWNESSITWANKPQDTAEDDIIQDFIFPETDGEEYTWDITEIARDWYLKGNTGLALRAPKDYEANSSGRVSYYKFGSEDYSIYQIPAATITYRSAIGIEPYYSYATFGVGNAGGVYLSDSMGQITAVRELASYASTVNPFSLNMVYNSVYFQKSGSTAYSPLQDMGLPMTMGNGWTLDAVQKIEPLTIGETSYLKYTDGDGTVHYFKKSGSVYLDEDGLGLEITESSGSYVMRDDMDNTWTFTGLGLSDVTGCFLTSTSDNNGNGYRLTYSSGKLTSIVQTNRQQSSVTVATLTYSGNNVSAIADATGDKYTLTYSSGNLTAVTRYYNTTSTYACAAYSYTGSRLTAMTDSQRSYTLHFGYGGTTGGVSTVATGRVTSYRETGNGEEGIRCDITYPSFTQTTYHDYGNDRTSGNSDDLYTHYLFDYAGRTINAYTTNAGGTKILGASTSVYTDNDGVSKTNNRVLRTASIGVAAQKLLAGGDFEGTAGSWSYTNAKASDTKPRTGVNSLRGTLSETATSASGTATTRALSSGVTYTLSGYINTSDMTSISGSGVYLQLKESNGSTYTTDAINYKTSSSTDSGWIRVSATFTATASAAATVTVYGANGIGRFFVDDIQLEASEAPSNYNLIENGDFQASSTAATGWNLYDNVFFHTGKGVNSDSANASCIRVDGDPGERSAYASQTVQIGRSGAQTYVLSGWGKADAVTDNIQLRSDPAYDHTKQFGMRVTVYYADDAEEDYNEYYYVPFNADVSAWQYASLTITPEEPYMTVSHMIVQLVYERNANTAYFDDISLVCATVQETEYDTNGNPILSASTGLNEQTVTYDSNGNVKTVVQRTGTSSSDKITHTYTYDSTFVHRVTSVSNGTTKQTSGYDAVGNVTASTLSSVSDSSYRKIVTSATYTNGGNLLASSTDAAGNTTTYGYGTLSGTWASDSDATTEFYKAFGIPSTVTNAKGTVTKYITDTFGRTREVLLADLASIQYTYSSGRLTQLQRTASRSGSSISQLYRLAYDGFDNVTSVGIGASGSTGAVTLATYTYGVDNGLLTRQTYGNGAAVSFTYDTLGRNKTTTYSDGRVLTYRYTGDGQLHSIRDSKTGYTYTYSYDSLGRLIASAVKNSSGTVIMQTRQEYNANNQLTGQHWTTSDGTYSETYTYSKTLGTLSGYTNALGENITLNYDSLLRLSSSTGGKYTKSYTYRNISSTNTTSQVASLVYSGFTGAPSYSYTYDVLGNIATYNQNGTTYTYSYDTQNQLLSQTGGGKTYSYTYDAAGNILTASDGTTSHTYTYGHATWKDLLTAFDGQTISYDASGNPTSYYNGTSWTLTWQEGRRLTAATNGTTGLAFAYDSEGLRLSKTVGTTVYNYYYAGGKLVKETVYVNGTRMHVLDFIYDHSGHPYALKHKTGGVTTTYYYITNLQGDVLSLVDTSGTAAAIYTYDPYGKPITATGTLANINPLRYRGYVYDHETGLYYLQSRYYDPAIGRFINADVFASTGQGMLGNNMFAYCRNNPVFRIDISGSADTAVEEEYDDDVEVTPAIPDGAGGGGGGNGGGGIVFGGKTPDPPRYPENPDNFNPKGLEKKVYVEPGTGKNGGIIKWFIPGTKQAVFEWDEDYSYGSHYHAIRVELGSDHIGDHNRPGSVIEEPWRSRYF